MVRLVSPPRPRPQPLPVRLHLLRAVPALARGIGDIGIEFERRGRMRGVLRYHFALEREGKQEGCGSVCGLPDVREVRAHGLSTEVDTKRGVRCYLRRAVIRIGVRFRLSDVQVVRQRRCRKRTVFITNLATSDVV